MRFGVHCRLWTTGWTNNDLDLIDHAKELGFSAFEVSMVNLDAIDPHKIRTRAEKTGMEIVGTISLRSDYALATPDQATRARTVEFLKTAVRTAREMGARLFGGMLYAVPGRFSGSGPKAEEFHWIVDGVRDLAVVARDCGVTIAIEPVNRYETYLINTAAQAQAVIDKVGEPNVGMLLDTYQMIIEERGIADTIFRHAASLRHLHLNESDRGMLGGGNIQWPAVFDVLKKIGYSGIGSIEVFGSPSPQIPTLTPVWRKLFPTPDRLAKDGLSFLQQYL